MRDTYEYHGLNDLCFFCITALAVTLVSRHAESCSRCLRISTQVAAASRAAARLRCYFVCAWHTELGPYAADGAVHKLRMHLYTDLRVPFLCLMQPAQVLYWHWGTTTATFKANVQSSFQQYGKSGMPLESTAAPCATAAAARRAYTLYCVSRGSCILMSICSKGATLCEHA